MEILGLNRSKKVKTNSYEIRIDVVKSKIAVNRDIRKMFENDHTVIVQSLGQIYLIAIPKIEIEAKTPSFIPNGAIATRSEFVNAIVNNNRGITRTVKQGYALNFKLVHEVEDIEFVMKNKFSHIYGDVNLRVYNVQRGEDVPLPKSYGKSRKVKGTLKGFQVTTETTNVEAQ